jgi:hypothetical protein
VHYRWLALHEVTLDCHRRVSLPDGEHLHCELPDGAMGAIPLWMTDPVTCAGFSFGEPLVSIEALSNLRALLDSVRSRHSTRAGTEGSGEESHKGPRVSASQEMTREVSGPIILRTLRSPGGEGKC